MTFAATVLPAGFATQIDVAAALAAAVADAKAAIDRAAEIRDAYARGTAAACAVLIDGGFELHTKIGNPGGTFPANGWLQLDDTETFSPADAVSYFAEIRRHLPQPPNRAEG